MMPLAVQLPDQRVGVLIARMGLIGCVEIGTQRILEAVPLPQLGFFHGTVIKDKPRAFWLGLNGSP